MTASTLLLSLALAGQCSGGYCPRPVVSSGWTYPVASSGWTYPVVSSGGTYPAASSGWTQAAIPAAQFIDSGPKEPAARPAAQPQQPQPGPYLVTEHGAKIRVWGTPRYDAAHNSWSIDWDRDHQPAGYPEVLSRPARPTGVIGAGMTGVSAVEGVDLAREPRSTTGDAPVWSNDRAATVAGLLDSPAPTPVSTAKDALAPTPPADQPAPGGPLKNLKTLLHPEPPDFTTPAAIIGGCILLGFVIFARIRASSAVEE